MLVSHIIGGLGNQMFQYAFGRALSLIYKVSLGLDISDFKKYRIHNGFELDRIFAIRAHVVSRKELRNQYGCLSYPAIWKISQIIESRLLIGKPFIIQNLHHPVERYVRLVNPNSYLKGYWQSESLFIDHADQIREDFEFHMPMNSENKEWADLIKNTIAISMHVRRGDYANNSKTQATHGLCPLTYYHEAIKYIGERINFPVFYIFSDDPEWVESNLSLPYPHHFLTHNKGTESYNDMRLMSLCRHHIIANSSFSWWGAWLNPRQDKIVVAPKNWFADAALCQEVVPDSWIKM